MPDDVTLPLLVAFVGFAIAIGQRRRAISGVAVLQRSLARAADSGQPALPNDAARVAAA